MSPARGDDRGTTPRIGYFAPDLSDPAVRRRVRMLRAGGAEVLPIGFRRCAEPILEIEGVATLDLGRTRDLKLASRAISVARAALAAPGWTSRLHGVDRLVARNLEMLLLACVAQGRLRPRPPLAYEVLDIHRLMLGRGAAGRILRALERRLARGVDLLVVSSPAFVHAYFARRWTAPPEVKLLENKVLDLPPDRWRRGVAPTFRPPWRIGWFGMLRCQKSLDLLCGLAARVDANVEVVIRGRPTLEIFRDFHGQIAASRNVVYFGPYAPAELPRHYGELHFAWAIDFYEEGLNSAWLLPNRLYEAQFMGVVPIALRAVETGRWLAAHGAGVLFDDPATELAPWFAALDVAAYAGFAAATQRVPDEALACGISDCEELVSSLPPRPAGARPL